MIDTITAAEARAAGEAATELENERLRSAFRSITRHGPGCDCGPRRAYDIAKDALADTNRDAAPGPGPGEKGNDAGYEGSAYCPACGATGPGWHHNGKWSCNRCASVYNRSALADTNRDEGVRKTSVQSTDSTDAGESQGASSSPEHTRGEGCPCRKCARRYLDRQLRGAFGPVPNTCLASHDAEPAGELLDGILEMAHAQPPAVEDVPNTRTAVSAEVHYACHCGCGHKVFLVRGASLALHEYLDHLAEHGPQGVRQ